MKKILLLLLSVFILSACAESNRMQEYHKFKEKFDKDPEGRCTVFTPSSIIGVATLINEVDMHNFYYQTIRNDDGTISIIDKQAGDLIKIITNDAGKKSRMFCSKDNFVIVSDNNKVAAGHFADSARECSLESDGYSGKSTRFYSSESLERCRTQTDGLSK